MMMMKINRLCSCTACYLFSSPVVNGSQTADGTNISQTEQSQFIQRQLCANVTQLSNNRRCEGRNRTVNLQESNVTHTQSVSDCVFENIVISLQLK